MAGKESPKTLIGQVATKHDKYRNHDFFFPSDDIPVSEKDAQWHLDWSQALWSLFIRGGCYNTVDDYERLQLMRLYGAGRQPNGVYMNLALAPQEQNPARHGWLSTNWDIFSPAPKLHREIRGRFEKQEYDYVATAVDPSSQTEKEDKMWNVWYNSQYGQKEKEIMSKIGVPSDTATEYIAQSLEELDLFKEMGGFKLKSEAELETVLDITDNISDIKTIKQKCIDDLVDWGKTAYRDYYDPVTGLVKYEYMDWMNLIVDFSHETDFKDIRFWSYLKFETINNVRSKNHNLEEHDLIEIAKLNCGMWGNMNADKFNSYSQWGYKTSKGVRTYDQFRIPVLISEWVSTDTEYKLEKVNKAGFKKTYPQEHGKFINTERKKTKVTQSNNVYQCSWIMGSNYVYDFGKSLNTARPNPKVPRLSIHAVAIPGKSIMEEIYPILDQLELGFVRWQSSIASAAPNGMDFNLSEMEDVSLGGNKMNVMEQVYLYQQAGHTFRRPIKLEGGGFNTGKTINRNEGGIGAFLNEIILTMDKNFMYINQLTGVDLVSLASAQQSEVTATQVKVATAQTSDALQPLYTSWIQMKEDGAITASCKIQRAIKYNPVSREAYTGMLGKTGVEVLRLGADKTPSDFGIKLEIRPTYEMKQAAIKAATEALAPGKNGENINLPDWWYFVNMIERGRAKHAMAILKYRLDKSKQEAIDMQRENMQLNGENALKQQQAKTEGSLMEIQAKGQVSMKEEATKALLQMEVSKNEALNGLKQEIILQILKGGEQPAQQNEAAA